jgi:hypothetical protein
MCLQHRIRQSLPRGLDGRSGTSLPVIVPRLGIQYQLTVELLEGGRHRLDESIMRQALELASQAFEQNLVSLTTHSGDGQTRRARL